MMNKPNLHFFSIAIVFILIITILMPAPARAAGSISAATTTAPRYYVNASAAPLGDGSTWSSAFQNLQDAITALQNNTTCWVNPCEIWVAQGYYQIGPGNSFYINGGLENIYGGFAGTESSLNQRDWRTHETILVGNNASVVYAYGFVGTLDGFTIRGGESTGALGFGGGIYIGCGAPGLFNLNITANSASAYGGGIYITAYSCPPPPSTPLRLLNVVISNNTAPNGGGIALLGKSPTLTNVAFFGNTATNGDGIYNYSSSPTLTNVSMSGDAIYIDNNSSPTLQNSILWGLANAITNSETSGIPTITYSLVKGCKPGGTWNTLCGTDGGHNLADADPLFVPGLPPDLHLQESSPAINQGDNTLIPGYVTTVDLDGNPRVVGSAVDLGAYEFQPDNVPPVVTNFAKTGPKNQNISFTLSDFTTHYSDADEDSLSSVRITSLPTQGTLYLVGNPVSINQEILPGPLDGLHFSHLPVGAEPSPLVGPPPMGKPTQPARRPSL